MPKSTAMVMSGRCHHRMGVLLKIRTSWYPKSVLNITTKQSQQCYMYGLKLRHERLINNPVVNSE